MAASVFLRNQYDKLVERICANPEGGDYRLLRDLIVQMRADGTPCGRIVVKLRPEWPVGERLNVAYSAAQAEFPDLPPLEWQGRKDPDGMSSRQKTRAGWHAKRAARGKPEEY